MLYGPEFQEGGRWRYCRRKPFSAARSLPSLPGIPVGYCVDCEGHATSLEAKLHFATYLVETHTTFEVEGPEYHRCAVGHKGSWLLPKLRRLPFLARFVPGATRFGAVILKNRFIPLCREHHAPALLVEVLMDVPRYDPTRIMEGTTHWEEA